MPQVAPLLGLIGPLVGALKAGTVLAFVLKTALVLGAQTLLGKLLAPPDPKQQGVKQKLESGGDTPVSFIMGEYATAGKLVYVNETDLHEDGTPPNNRLTMVISLSELPITSVSNFCWINGEKCTIDFSSPDADGYFPVTDYDQNGSQYCKVKFYDGTQTATDPWLIDRYSIDREPNKPWTSDMIGRGVAYAIVQCLYSSKGVWSGVPEFKFVAKGLKLYDWRKDSTNGGSGAQRWQTPSTWAWTENPVVMKYNIIRGLYYNGDWVWGGQSNAASNVDAYQLPVAYWTAAANHCDELVTLGDSTTVKRYTAGCEIHVDQQPIDVIKELDKTCTGYTAEYGGLWKTWAGPAGSSVFSFTDDDIIITEDQTDNLFAPVQNTFNGARATYVNQNAGWVMKDAAPRIFDGTGGNADLQAEDDGLQLIADIQLPCVTNWNQTQRLMRSAVLESRKQITHTMQMPPEAYILEPYDVVNWNSARNGYVNKKFMVTSIEDLPNCNQIVALREVNPSDYDWNVSYELPDSVGTLTPIRPSQLALDFTVSPDQVDRPSGGKDKPAILIEWDWGADDIDLDYVKYEVRRSVSQPKVIASGTFHNIADNSRTITSAAFRFKQSFQVRLWAQPHRSGRSSSWTGWKTVTLTNIDVPGAPTLSRVSDLANNGNLNFFLDIDWTAIAAEGLYYVRVISDSNSRFYSAPENSIRVPVTSGKTYAVDVRFVTADSKGDWSSATSITVTKKNTAPTTPVGTPVDLSGVGDNHRIYLTLPKSTESDFARSIIYGATSNNFLVANEVGRTGSTKFTHDKLGNGQQWWYWITYEDTSGNESAKYPASNTAGKTATTVRVVDDDTDPTAPGTPSAPALNQDTADVDGDSTIDTGLSMALSLPSGVPVKYFEVQIWRSSTLGGTYTALAKRHLVKAESSGTTDYAFEGSTTKFYKARYRGIAFGGKEGSYSPLTATGVQPLQYLSSIPTPTMTVTPKPKGMALKWTKWQNSTYLESIVYRDGAELTRIKGNSYTDNDELSVNTSYAYTVQHQDKQDRVGALSSSVSGTYRAALTADISAKAITPTLTDLGDTSNMTVDTNLAEPDAWTTNLAGLTRAVPNIVSASQYRLIASPATTSACYIQSAAGYRIPVEGGKRYTYSASIGSNIGVSATFSIRINWFSRDGSGNPVSISQVTVASFTGSTIQKLLGIVLAPANASWAEIIAFKGSSAVASSLEFNEPVFRRTIDNDLMGAGSRSGCQYGPGPHDFGAWAGSLTISQAPRTVDAGDGRIDIQVTMTASAIPTGAKSVEFIVDFDPSGSHDLRYFPATGLKASFVAAVGKLYSVVHRGVSFNNVPGPSLAIPVTITPVKKTGAHPAPTNLVTDLTSRMGQTNIAAIIGTGLQSDYAYTKFYLGTVNDINDASTDIYTAIAAGSVATSWRAIFQAINLAPGTTYYVWAENFNSTGIGSGAYPTNPTGGVSFVAGFVDDTYANATFFNDGISAMGVGAVGTYAFLKKTSAGTTAAGGTENGSDLVYSDTSLGTGSNPSGNWKCMGRCPSGQATQWLRVS